MLKTCTAPQAPRTLSDKQAQSRPGSGQFWRKRGLVLILLLAVVVAGCAPQVAAGSWAGLSVDDNGLIMANLDRVTRMNEAGTARWEFPAPSDRNQSTQFYATPVLTEDAIYVGGFDHKVYALDRDNGLQIWINEDSPSQIIAGLALSDGKLIVGLGGEGVMALNQLDGVQLWMVPTGQGVWATPLIVDSTVYVTSLDHYLYALDLATGEELWRQELEGAIAGTPAYEDGFLYVGSFAHKLFKLNASTGEIVSDFEARNWIWGGPALADGVLYFGDLSGYLYALNTTDLSPVWQREVASSAIRATPLIVGNMLVIGSRDGHVYAVERDNGTPVWTQTAPAAVLSDAVVLSDGLVVVSTINPESMLIAYDPNDSGRQMWQYPPAASTTE
jgi:outer membrane protein assembly factor BamB